MTYFLRRIRMGSSSPEIFIQGFLGSGGFVSANGDSVAWFLIYIAA